MNTFGSFVSVTDANKICVCFVMLGKTSTEGVAPGAQADALP